MLQQIFESYGFLAVNIIIQMILAMATAMPIRGGALSLASPGFFAMGGYVAAVFSTRIFDFSIAPPGSLLCLFYFLVECFVAVILGSFVAFLIGLPVLKLRGVYFAIATLSFVEILRVICLNLEITGGAVGIFAIPQLFNSPAEYLILLIPIILLLILVIRKFEGSSTGQELIAIRDDELASQAVGIMVGKIRLKSFVLSGAIAALIGVPAAHIMNTWNARQGTFDASVNTLAFVMVGGSRSMWGAILGAFVLTALPESLRFLQDSRLIVNGLCLLGAALFFPNGLWGALQKFFVVMKKKPAKKGKQHD